MILTPHRLRFRRLLSTLVFFIALLNGVSHATTEYKLETVASGFINPWAMSFLPNHDILVTERSGKLKVVRNGEIMSQLVTGVPDVYFAGQGGLLDVMLDDNYTINKTIYLSFSHGERNANSTRLISAQLTKTDQHYSLSDVKTLFTAFPTKKTAHHHGGRIAQLDDSSLIMTVGDGFNYREKAQTLDNHFGKIIRIKRDGLTPKNNPFTKTDGALPEIYSYGHRNQQALLAFDGDIFEHEHGPKGGDEVNRIKAGANYGWPIATHGIDYTGARISPFSSYEGMQSPEVNWTPSIAPSSMAMHKGALYVTSLAEGSIRKLLIKPISIEDQGIVYDRLNERLRDIVSAPDGHLYVLTDGDNARLVKIIEE